MAKILIDTGVFVALFDGDDKFHQKSVAFIKNNRSPLMTTLANITEVLYLLTDSKTQYEFLNWLNLARIEIAPLTHREMTAIGEMMVQYDNVPMDFADGCLLYLANIPTKSIKLQPLIAIFAFIALMENTLFVY